MQKVKADLANARKKFALLEDPDLNCPIGSEASCKFLADAVGAAKSIPKFEALLADLTHKAEGQKFKEERDVGECKVIIDIAKKEAAGLEKIYAAIEVLDRGKWEKKAQEIDRAETEIDHDRTRLAEATAEEIDLGKQLKAMGEPPSREALDTELRSLEKPISDLEKQIKIAEASRDLSNVEIGQFKARLTACREATEKQKKLTKDEAELTGSITVLSEYVRAVSRDGLPFLLLEKALPTLQTYTNEFLGSGSDNGQFLRVKIDPLRDLVTGEQRNEVVIWFDDEKGTHPLTEASGAQRNRLGYSLRCALARIQAEAIGCEVKLAWLDEGWGAFDESNIVLAQGMLKRFADVFERVIFITHMSEVKEIAETIITVRPDPKNGSTLEVS
jgi:DNA repair exonuclease SbcCD ATPase subunit